jgi:eukaryotic-like serine/threonine-protein kinase
MGDRLARVRLHLDSAVRLESSGREASLPDDMLQETAQRLALFCGVGAATWTIGLIMENVLRPVSVPTAFPWPGNLIASVMIVTLAASAFFVWSRPTEHGDRAFDLGLVLLIINALAIAIINEWVSTFPDTRYVSWNTILILVYAMVVPTDPGKMLVACLVAASMDPVALGIANMRGLVAPGFPEGVVLYYPNYICAVIAVVPSVAMHRIGRRIIKARELGSYELVEKINQGGMGEVWRAEHRLLVRPAAVKLVRPDMLRLGNEHEVRAVLNRFEREAQATAVLDSPHTIELFDYGLTRDGVFYYVMELLSGRDLESLVRDFGALPPDRVMYLLRQICHSLAEAHLRGLVHRDIKPANIYVCRMGLDYDFVKVLDFGLVTFSARGGGRTLLAANHVTTGTPAYMAPEVIMGEAQVDSRADVYSIGCLAYWMLTGELVFEADSPMAMMMAHVVQTPRPPSERIELPIPRELDRMVLACLEKDPNRRPQNAEVLCQMWVACTSQDSSSQVSARRWWEAHLPELTQPHVLAVPAASQVSTVRAEASTRW